MKLQTTVPIAKPSFGISHQDKILSIGSCFAQNMASFLEERKFQMVSNPFGILYNPLSIANGLRIVLNNKKYGESDLFQHNERWHSFDHHSTFSHSETKTALENINTAIGEAHKQLLAADILIITLGTSFVYFEKSENRPVANCHKLSANYFEKKKIDVLTVFETLIHTVESIQKKNPKIKIIFTISPIRHIRDGYIENQQSKATLVLAMEKLMQQLKNVFYFPSYEIVLDELRDYRFYATDLVHLNELGLAYIWEKFEDIFFDEKTKQTNLDFLKLQKAMQHRPFYPEAAPHQRFLKKYFGLTETYQTAFPHLNFKEELAYFGNFNNDSK